MVLNMTHYAIFPEYLKPETRIQKTISSASKVEETVCKQYSDICRRDRRNERRLVRSCPFLVRTTEDDDWEGWKMNTGLFGLDCSCLLLFGTYSRATRSIYQLQGILE